MISLIIINTIIIFILVFLLVETKLKNMDQRKVYLDKLSSLAQEMNSISKEPVTVMKFNAINQSHPFEMVGFLQKLDEEKDHKRSKFLPLYARPVSRRRNQWQYYTMTEKTDIILPIRNMRFKNEKRYCTQEYYYCDMISNGDIVEIRGYEEDKFKVNLY